MDIDITTIWEDLTLEDGGSIVYVVIDGVGGLPDPERGGTELQIATIHYSPYIQISFGWQSCI